MEASKVITYSLLAQIRNSGNFVNSSVEIFVPIVKYALYKLITQSGVYKGASIMKYLRGFANTLVWIFLLLF